MAVLTVTRSTTLFNDANGNGKADPNDKLLTHILFTPPPATTLHGVTVSDPTNGSTVVSGSVLVTESDVFSIVGNTPISFTAAQVLANDFNGDGPNQGNNTGLTVTAATESDGHGSVALGAGGTVTFTPATGYVGDATYTYTVTDALGTIGTASVTVHITSDIWYVDSAYTGANGASDGSFLKPFTGTTSVGAVDHINDTIFVYNHGASYTGNITLKTGESLIGDGVAFTANGITVGTGANGNATLTAATGTIVTLASNNDVEGVTLTGTGTAAGMTGTNFGTLTVAHTSIGTANGQILGLTGGTISGLGATFTSLASTGTVAGNAITLSNVDGGTFTSGGTTIAATSTAGHGIDIDGGSSATFAFNGTTSITNAAGDAVHIDGASTAGDGAVTIASLTVTTPTGNGVSIANDTGAVTVTAGTLAGGANNDDLHIAGGSANVSIGATMAKTTAGNPVDISGHTGGIIALTGAISASGGTAGGISVTSNTGGTINFSGAETLSTGANTAVNLASNTGATINFSGGSLALTTTSGTGLSVTGGGTVNVTENGVTIGTTSGAGVNVAAGTVTLSGSGLAITTTAGGAGVNATGGALTLSGGTLAITTSSGGTGFIATGGTVAVTGTGNSIHATSGIGLNISGATIAAANVTFHDISSSGASNGIILANTGASGGLHVTGGGSVVPGGDNSGGIIQNTTGDGISLINTQNVSLTNMDIHDTGGSGVNGFGVTNFTLANSTINNSGNALLESNIAFNNSGAQTGNSIAGVVSITGNTLTNAFYSGIDIQGDSGTITNLTISNNTITSSTVAASTHGSGIDIAGTGNASTAFSIDKATIDSNTISNFPTGDGINFSVGNANASGPAAHAGTIGSANVIAITNNIIHGQSVANPIANQGIAVADTGGNSAARTQVNAVVSGNNVQNAFGTSILIGNNGFSDMSITVSGNTIVGVGEADLGGANGIGGGNGVGGAGNAWTPHLTAIIENNNISQTDGNGILMVGRGTSGELDLKIDGNTVAAPTNAGGTAREGIRIDAGNASSADDAVFLDIFNNTSAGSNTASGIGIRKQGTVATTNDFGILDAPGGPSLPATPTNADITNFINALNPNSATGGGFGTGGTDIISGSNFLRDTTHAPLLVAAPAPVDTTALPEKPINDPGVTVGAPAGPPADTTPPADTNPAATVPVTTAALTQALLDSFVAAAIDRWAAAGATPQEIAAMKAVSVTVANIAGLQVGDATPGHVQIDSDGGGYGWFLDSTPGENSEFTGTGTDLHAVAGGAADGKVDLLTVLMHELGHQIGLVDDYAPADSADLMYGFVNPGERRLPSSADVAAATGTPVDHESFALAPIAIGTVTAPTIVQVSFQSTVNAFTAGGLVPSFDNQAAVNSTDLPGAVLSNHETLSTLSTPALASLTIGDTVYVDTNHNGSFDAGEGVANVALTLFAKGTVANPGSGPDVDGDGIADTQVETATTGPGGIYSFPSLTQGDYIVRVDATNFAAGHALAGDVVAPGGVADPNNDVDNDSNAIAGTGFAFSNAVHIDFAPAPGGSNTNNTVDLGFVLANQAPVNSVPGAQSGTEDTNIVFNAAHSNTISISDVDGGSGNETVDLSVLHGTLTLSTEAGLTVTGDGSGAVHLTGTIANINAALNGLTYAPNANYNGADTLTIATNDNGNTGGGGPLTDTDTVAITLAAVNDAPVVSTSPPVTTPEQTPVILNAALSVSDVDLDPKNGGAGDYAGATFVINENSPSANDVFSFAASAGFTVSGNNLQSGGLTFATFTQSGGVLNINFTSSGTIATTALVNDVVDHLQYTNTSDTPPASVTLIYGLNDGAPGGGQGTVVAGNNFTGHQIVVNITAVNDPPAIDLNGVAVGTNATLNYTENQAPTAIAPSATVTDPDSPNFNTGTLTVQFTANGAAEDRLTIIDQGAGAGHITVSGSNVSFGGTVIGTFTGGTDGATPLVVTFNANATPAAVQALAADIAYSDVSDNPSALARTVSVTVTDDQGAASNVANATINVTAVNDPTVANDDTATTDEAHSVNIAVLANDTDPDSAKAGVAKVDGNPIAVGGTVTIASGAHVTLNADGTLTYDPNGKFNTLTSTAGGESGAVNTSAVDSFTYTNTDNNSANVAVTVNGLASADDQLKGDSGDNTITGTANGDLFVLQQGGNDTVSGLAGNDIFYFGAVLNAADHIDGGPGNDILAMQGNYTGANKLILGTGGVSNITGIESLALLSGSNTHFGDTAGNLYSYDITMFDGAVAAGTQMKVNGGNLLSGENFTFDGSNIHNGSLLLYGGQGVDHLTGGDGNDFFFFDGANRFAPGDQLNGGPGSNQVYLRGNYVIDFTQPGWAGVFQNIDGVTLMSASDARFGSGGGAFSSYSLTVADSMLATGATMTYNAGLLLSNETFSFDGHLETGGNFRIFGGAANDTIIGGGGNDLIYGGLGSDTLTGGGGSNTFQYRSAAESTPSTTDHITDFKTGDIIDLSRIDADTNTPGDQAFTFVTGGFTHHAGELMAVETDTVNHIWTISADVNGDGVADFQVLVTVADHHTLHGSDFLL